MIIRVQSSEGTKRIELGNDDVMGSLLKKINVHFNITGQSWKLYKERNQQKEIKLNARTKLKTFGLKHGDMVFLHVLNAGERPMSSISHLSSNGSSASLPSTKTEVREDEIDVLLWKQDGRIKRSGSNKGLFKLDDLAAEPWDESYLKEKEIKFMSFHAFMRKQTSGVDKGKFFKFENFQAASKYNAGDGKVSVVDIPSAVTLNRQKYRHVDNITFENREIVDRFLNYWRSSGHQRMGYLYGRYVPHPDVPLGIRSEVCAIYEPPQESTGNSLLLLPDQNDEIVDMIASKMGVRKIGWILTDLLAEDTKKGTVKHIRNVDTHFLSAEECITAATFQNKFKNPCRLASNGFYGSKFATVIVSGNKDLEISFEGYQVSNQGMSLVADGCLLPTIDAPELGYVKESTPELFVADVYFTEKDEYGNEITKLARPLPLEFLLTEVPTAFTKEAQYSCSTHIAEFPLCNRAIVGHLQSLSALSKYFKQFSDDTFVKAMSDFHVLVYLATNDTIALKGEMEMLLEAVKLQDNQLALQWSENSPNWSTLQELMKHTSVSMDHMTGGNDHQDMDAEMREAIQRSLQHH